LGNSLAIAPTKQSCITGESLKSLRKWGELLNANESVGGVLTTLRFSRIVIRVAPALCIKCVINYGFGAKQIST